MIKSLNGGELSDDLKIVIGVINLIKKRSVSYVGLQEVK